MNLNILFNFESGKFFIVIYQDSSFPPKVGAETSSVANMFDTVPALKLACGPRTTCVLTKMRQDGRIRRHYVTPHGDVIEILLMMLLFIMKII